MKKAIFFLFIFATVSLATAQQKSQDEVLRLSEPVETGENYEVFGSEYPKEVKEKSLTQLIADSKKYKGQEIATKGMIKQVCQKKGCFFILVDEENEARITFKDYKFFILTDAPGKEARLLGQFRVKQISEEQAKHYAEDAGNDAGAIKGPQQEYSIIATSVKITDAKSD